MNKTVLICKKRVVRILKIKFVRNRKGIDAKGHQYDILIPDIYMLSWRL